MNLNGSFLVMRSVSFLKNKEIAHRGLYNNDKGIYENTLSSFKNALKNGYPIELDVHLTKDNKVIVFHDSNLKRLFNNKKKVKNLTYEELIKYKYPSSLESIPLLEEVLKLVNGKVPLIIELKCDQRVGLLENEVVKLLKNYQGNYALKSFRFKSVYYLKKHYPYIIRGQLLSYKGFLSYLLFNIRIYLSKLSKPDFYSCKITNVDNKKISKLKENNLILGWTIKNKNDIKYIKRYVDNYIFERK